MFYVMNMIFDDNSTRRIIINLLKKSNGLSIEEMSKSVNITPMGIRQHLLSLEKKGVVTHRAEKHGIGRPGFVYMLTDAADALFNKSYDNFAIELLKDIRQHKGAEKVDTIFRWRKDKQLSAMKEALAGSETLRDTLDSLKDLLESEGLIVELTRNNGSYHLINYNCPIRKIAEHFPELCAYDLQLFRELLGKKVMAEHTISDGSPACIYKIPAN